MPGHHFISYSGADARDFAIRLHDALEAGPPHVPAWLDRRDILPGQDWDAEIDKAIQTCASLLFVLSPNSVEDRSVCKQEWSRALRFKKPVVPILFDRTAVPPLPPGESPAPRLHRLLRPGPGQRAELSCVPGIARRGPPRAGGPPRGRPPRPPPRGQSGARGPHPGRHRPVGVRNCPATANRRRS